jgi:glyoxylase-like metal-dependent hydrolase (beta-lactamase superfamily II)
VIEQSGCVVWGHPAHAHFTDATRRPDEIYAKRWRRSEQEGVPERWLDVYASVQEELHAIDGDFAIDHDAVEGTMVPTGLGPLRVIETPGHAPSHIGLYHEPSGLLVSADLIFAGFAPHYDYGNTPDPVGEFVSSLGRIEALDVDLALPGHGRAMQRDEIAAAIVGHRAGVRERLERVRAALRDGAENGWQVLERFDPEIATDPHGSWIFGEVLCYLRHLRLRGQVERSLNADGKFVHRLR